MNKNICNYIASLVFFYTEGFISKGISAVIRKGRDLTVPVLLYGLV